MYLQKLIKWFPTNAGKNFSVGLAATTSIGSFLVYYLPNTFLLDYYKDLVTLYRSGFTVPLSKTLKERFEKALDYSEIPEEDKNLLTPFHVIGFDVFSTGTTYSKFGGIVGLPINFTYNDVNAIDKSAIQVNGKNVVWSLSEAQDLLKSLILSEDAQIFAMCKEIKMCNSPKLLLDTFSATVAVLTTYTTCHIVNEKLNLFSRPLSLRLVLYTLATLFYAGNYCLWKDYTQVHYEAKIDKELKMKDPKLAKGGSEFYEQILKRNIALRKLMGKEGESLYSVLGNENYLLRQKHLPLVQRRDFFKENVAYNY